jgi:hypothetical protein
MDANLQALRRLKGVLGGLPANATRADDASVTPASAPRLP